MVDTTRTFPLALPLRAPTPQVVCLHHTRCLLITTWVPFVSILLLVRVVPRLIVAIAQKTGGAGMESNVV
ncbi:hypothetical protein AN958_10332 [Leucoagaricus sp. SymC.cos]|nr:hypothetical protein AN958_10332 [Leucoagaricus sp. SymC.cos]